MDLKSDINVVKDIGGKLKVRADAIRELRNTVRYAEESNLTAVATGKRVGEQGDNIIGTYKVLLKTDIVRIIRTGEAFTALDKVVSDKVKGSR